MCKFIFAALSFSRRLDYPPVRGCGYIRSSSPFCASPGRPSEVEVAGCKQSETRLGRLNTVSSAFGGNTAFYSTEFVRLLVGSRHTNRDQSGNRTRKIGTQPPPKLKILFFYLRPGPHGTVLMTKSSFPAADSPKAQERNMTLRTKPCQMREPDCNSDESGRKPIVMLWLGKMMQSASNQKATRSRVSGRRTRNFTSARSLSDRLQWTPFEPSCRYRMHGVP